MRKKHGLTVVALSLAVIFALLCIATVVVFSLTFRQLGLADKQLTQQSTLSDLGLDQVTVGQAFGFLRAISARPDVEKIAPNAYSNVDAQSANVKFASTSIGFVSETPNYENLLYSSAVFVRPFTLKQTELAYALDTALHMFYSSERGELAAEYVGAVEILKRLDASVVETSFVRDEGKCILKTVVKLNVSQFVAEINEKIPFVGVQDVVYCTLVNEVEVKNKTILGILQLRGRLALKNFVGVYVNDQDADISETALNALFMATSDNGETALSCKVVNLGVCALISDFCGNIGGIGVKDSSDSRYGIEGIDFENGQITFLPKLS